MVGFRKQTMLVIFLKGWWYGLDYKRSFHDVSHMLEMAFWQKALKAFFTCHILQSCVNGSGGY